MTDEMQTLISALAVVCNELEQLKSIADGQAQMINVLRTSQTKKEQDLVDQIANLSNKCSQYEKQLEYQYKRQLDERINPNER